MKEVCANCKWYENVPFSDERICACEDSDFADCPCDNPLKDTCDEFTERED